MSNWTLVKLGDICTISKGEQLNRIDLEDEGEYPCINGGISPSGFTENWNTEANTITISEGGNSCGYISFQRKRFWSGGHCYSLLELKNNVFNDFLFQALKGNESSIMSLRVGSGLPNIQQKAIRNFEIFIPESNSEQRQIAKILSTADAVIEKTQAAIAKYKAIKQGMLHDLFTRGIDIKTGKLRPTYKDAPELYKPSKLGMVPKDWDVEEINKIGEVISGATPSTSVKEFWDGDIVWITPADLSKQKESIYFQTAARKISELGLISCSANLIDKNNLVISSRAPIGYLSIIKSSFTTNQGCKSIRFYKNQVPEYYYYNLLLNVERLKTFGEGTTFAEISKADLDIFNVVVCDKEEQKLISAKLLTIDNNITTEQNYLQKLQQLKSGLMGDLLSGRKKVKVKDGLKEKV